MILVLCFAAACAESELRACVCRWIRAAAQHTRCGDFPLFCHLIGMMEHWLNARTLKSDFLQCSRLEVNTFERCCVFAHAARARNLVRSLACCLLVVECLGRTFISATNKGLKASSQAYKGSCNHRYRLHAHVLTSCMHTRSMIATTCWHRAGSARTSR